MKLRSVYGLVPVLCWMLAVPVSAGEELSADYGTLTGQFVFDGPVPEPVVLHKKGAPETKNPEICAVEDHFRNDLVIDKDTKGVRNVFIYIKSIKDVHPSLKTSPKPTVVFDQKNCRFTPKALFVRTDQQVLVMSDDAIVHNTHTYPIRNKGVNLLIGANNRDGEPIANPRPELLPFEVKCDLHPWMKAHWLVLDHPYAAISNEKGEFKIEKLPAGQHEFRMWQERVGYIHRRLVESGKFIVNVKGGEVTKLDPIKLKPEWFEDED